MREEDEERTPATAVGARAAISELANGEVASVLLFPSPCVSEERYSVVAGESLVLCSAERGRPAAAATVSAASAGPDICADVKDIASCCCCCDNVSGLRAALAECLCCRTLGK